MKKDLFYVIPKVEFLMLSEVDLLTISGCGENEIELGEIPFINN